MLNFRITSKVCAARASELCPIPTNLKVRSISSLLSILENFMPEIYTLI